MVSKSDGIASYLPFPNVRVFFASMYLTNVYALCIMICNIKLLLMHMKYTLPLIGTNRMSNVILLLQVSTR
jgi:hypothetical protein